MAAQAAPFIVHCDVPPGAEKTTMASKRGLRDKEASGNVVAAPVTTKATKACTGVGEGGVAAAGALAAADADPVGTSVAVEARGVARGRIYGGGNVRVIGLPTGGKTRKAGKTKLAYTF